MQDENVERGQQSFAFDILKHIKVSVIIGFAGAGITLGKRTVLLLKVCLPDFPEP